MGLVYAWGLYENMTSVDFVLRGSSDLMMPNERLLMQRKPRTYR